MSRLFLVCLMFAFFLSFDVYAQEGLGGSTLNSFDKDIRNIPFPRDRNSKIIDGSEILKALPDNNTVATIYVSDFDFTGNRLFDKKTLKALVLDYMGRDLTLAEIYDASEVITSYYRSKGYIISYAYIPPQVVDKGLVTIRVQEGEIGEFIIEGLTDYKKSFILAHLEPLKKDVILHSYNLERKLLILNSYMDLNVRASLVPGKTPGTSDIIIYASDKFPYRVSVSADDYGDKNTSLFRLNAAALVGNLFTSGDRLGVHLSMGLDNFNPEDLFYGRLEYRLPLGGDGFKLGINYAHGNYRGVKEFRPLNIRGSSDEYSLFVEYPLFLRTDFTLNVMGSFTKKDIFEKIFGQRNAADGIYTLTAGLFGEFYPWWGSAFFYSMSVDQGINPIFNGSHLSGGSTNPKASGTFERFTFNLDYYQNIIKYLRFRGSFSGQVASGAMFASEKFYIGGMYSVRGFANGADSGDYGYRLSLEFEADLYTPIVKAVLFYDRGYVVNSNKNFAGYANASLDSIGAGLHIHPYQGISIKADYGYPLAATRQQLSDGAIYLRLGYDF